MMVLYILSIILLVIIVCLLSLYLYMNSLKRKKLLYDIDESKKIKITKDIVYKEVDNKSLLLDVYTPETLISDEKLPVVIFVHGEGPELFIRDAKDWQLYSSYGKLLSSMGFVAVTFNHRYATMNFTKIKDVSKDVSDAVDYIKNNGSQWNIDLNKICVWSFSLGGIYSSIFLKDQSMRVKCLVSYYGLLDIYAKVPKKGTILEDFAPENYLSNLNSNKTSILIVKAANDKIKGVNKSIDNFIKVAKQYNINYEYILHNTAGHSFDALDDNNETRRVIGQTLRYIEQNCK